MSFNVPPLLDLSPDAVGSLSECIIFPPKLPQCSEADPKVRQAELLKFWLHGLSIYTSGTVEPMIQERLQDFATSTSQLHDGMYPSATAIQNAFRELELGGGFALYLEQQNCAIMVHRKVESTFTLEMFEVSARNASVMSSRGPLERLFPGVALQMPLEFLFNQDAIVELSRTLADFASTSIPSFVPITCKANESCKEIRDTNSPAGVTQALATVLLAHGAPVNVTGTQKHVHDEVNWDNSREPWRRPPMWLVLRVASQRWLENTLGKQLGLHHYKNLQIVIISELCRQISASENMEDSMVFARAKLGRRLNKLRMSQSLDENVDSYACNTLEEARKISAHRWQTVQSSVSRSVRPCPQISPRDLDLQLRTSSARIQKELAPIEDTAILTFDGPANCRPRLLTDLDGPTKTLQNTDFNGVELDLLISLYDFERHVCNVECDPNLNNCRAIVEMFMKYKSASADLYSHNVDCSSVRLLTLVELWVQLDQVVLGIEPMIKKLDPQIPPDFMRHLRLLHRSDMERVVRIETYINQRSAESHGMSPFSDDTMRKFAGQYHDHALFGASMRDVRLTIEEDANQRRSEKLKEWFLAKDKCTSLQERAKRITHDTAHDRWGNPYCRSGCELCSVTSQIEGIWITPFEQPLPGKEPDAKWVVFELLCPESIRCWRDITWILITDLGRSRPLNKTEISCHLFDFHGLSAYQNHERTRLSLATTVKPFEKAHYGRDLQVARIEMGDVDLPHGAKWFLFDAALNIDPWIVRSQVPGLMRNYEGLLPQHGLYLSCTKAITSTENSPNQVMAWQCRAPELMTLYEFNSFNALRSGESIQWLNILVELASPSLQLSKIETHWLITQAALEIGTGRDLQVLRKTHHLLAHLPFCEKLLDLLQRQVSAARANWKEHNRLHTLLILTLRLESLAPFDQIQSSCCALRDSIRKASLAWTRQLKQDLDVSPQITHRSSQQDVRLSAALLCRATYSAHDKLISTDWTAYFECGFLLANEAPTKLVGPPDELPHRMVQDWNAACKLEPLAREAVSAYPHQLDAAVQRVWPSGQQSEKWRSLEEPNNRWLFTHTVASMEKKSVQLHVNVLSGEILIDGKTPGRLPKAYLKDKQYIELFGHKSVSTTPSPVKGAEYLSEVDGCILHFGWDESGIRIYREVKAGNVDLLIPRSSFVGRERDLPQTLLANHVHWLRIGGKHSGFIHICPIKRCFGAAGGGDWLISFTKRSATRRECRLLDPGCTPVRHLSNMLGAFEAQKNLIAYTDRTHQIVLYLARYGLSFEVCPDGMLFCRELNAQVIRDQSLGTLIGLSGYLRMREKSSDQRIAIVPHGKMILKSKAHHVGVFIDTESLENVQFSRFTFNPYLNRLDCNGEPRDMLIKAYLHAVTSGPLPDAFTGRRGTEEAVSVLQELDRQMYEPLEDEVETRELLLLIYKLTPTRNYYPENLKIMQRTFWHSVLPMHAQSDQFNPLVLSIRKHSDCLRTFHGQALKEPPEGLPSSDNLLHERAVQRNTKFSARRCRETYSEPGANMLYKARDSLELNDSTKRVFEVTNLVKRWASDASRHDLVAILSGTGDIKGFNRAFRTSSIADLFSQDVAEIFGSLFERTRHANRARDQTAFTFLFPFLAFDSDYISAEKVMSIIKAVLCLAFHPDIQTMKSPEVVFFADFNVHQSLSKDLIHQALLDSDNDPYPPLLSCETYEGNDAFRNRQQSANHQHQAAVEDEARAVATAIIDQWPCEIVSKPGQITCRVSFQIAQSKIQDHFTYCWHNRKLAEWLSSLSNSLNGKRTGRYQPLELSVGGVQHNPVSRKSVSLDRVDILQEALERYKASSRWTSTLASHKEKEQLLELLPVQRREHTPGPDEECLQELSTILSPNDNLESPIHVSFFEELQGSLEALRAAEADSRPHLDTSSLDHEAISARQKEQEKALAAKLKVLTTAVENYSGFKHLTLGGLWPRYKTADFLQILGARSQNSLSSGLQEDIRELAIELIGLQRLERVRLHHQQHDLIKVANDILCRAHTWDTLAYAEWLIIEIEMNACIRPEQADMALSMAHPPEGQNSIYQLQMGKGKSSLIIPMLAAILPTKSNLARIVVPKPLFSQMGSMLKQRLCRLLQRPLLHLPFHRASPKDKESLNIYRSMHEEIMSQFGAVLALPEHMQSLDLCGIQRLLDGEIEQGTTLMDIQAWFDCHARDVLDECDHILSPRTQLIYPSGTQTPVDGSARRWRMIASILRFVFEVIGKYASAHSDQVQVESTSPATFPLIHIQSPGAGKLLMEYLVDRLTSPAESPLPLKRITDARRLQEIRACVKNGPLSASIMDTIEKRFQDQFAVNDFLIMRGILGGGILLLALQKRWNVQYGLALGRCHIAVPYVARGKPSLASEYGHPDVAITLTYLAYYYNGLQESQLRLALEKLQLEQNPLLEWAEWTRFARSLPTHLQSWTAVNVDDSQLLHELWKSLSRSPPAVNFYLDKLVFPRAAREFERKLVSSSWDIPLSTPQITTGFSGTNDNSRLLPDSISPQFVPAHGLANAEVLWHLLQQRNRGYIRTADHDGKSLSVEGLLDLVSKQKFDVLLDAGALILEMENSQVAVYWLTLRSDVSAVAYFNEAGTLSVRQRDGQVDLLVNSRYAANMEGCLLYLDEEHCRGTDTRLPTNARAALTIGPRQPKDHTVQAAMRMRQLAHCQSVVFLASPPVDKSIRDYCDLTSSAAIDSSHIISWSIKQSCDYIISHLSLRDSQRRSFKNRTERVAEVRSAAIDEKIAAAQSVTEPEKKTLYELYGPHSEIDDVEARFNDLRVVETDAGQTISLACAEEEQERQVDQETQEEQQREQAEEDEPLKHNLHPDILAFVRHGQHIPDSTAYAPCWKYMKQLKAFTNVGAQAFERLMKGSQLLVTADLFNTIKTALNTTADHAQRPVRFLTWTSHAPGYLLVISPFEANELMQEFENSTHAHLLLFEAPRNKEMIAEFQESRFFGYPQLPKENAIPTRIKQELFFFAGGIFFSWASRHEIVKYARYLNQLLDPNDEKRNPSDIGIEIARKWSQWLQIRMHGMGFDLSPVGYLLEDRTLNQTDAIFGL